MAAPDRLSLLQAVDDRSAQLRRIMRARLQQVQQRLDYSQRALASPRAPLQALAERVHALTLRTGHALSGRIVGLRRRSDDLAVRGRRMAPKTEVAQHLTQRRRAALSAAGRHLLRGYEGRLRTLAARLEALDPHAVLARGYALAADANGRVVTDAAQLAAGDLLGLRFARGRASARVLTAEPVAGEGEPPRGEG
jgi:exodeoxyribonuclease VII large subunit